MDHITDIKMTQEQRQALRLYFKIQEVVALFGICSSQELQAIIYWLNEDAINVDLEDKFALLGTAQICANYIKGFDE